jgi:integrase
LVWHYRFNAGGKDYSGSTEATDLPTAKLVLEEARRQAILIGIGQGQAPTLGITIDQWTETRGRLVSAWHLTAAGKARASLGKLTKLPLDRITTSEVQGWLADYLEDHSPASANLVLRYLKLWTRWALAEALIRSMPFAVKPIKVQQRARPVADLGLLDKVTASATNPQIRAALALCMTCGLREAELLQARWEWIRGDVFTVGGNTKSKKIRAIPIAEVARVALLQMLAAKEHGPAQALPRLGLIFPGKKGKPHSQGWLRQALERSEIKGLGMHRLRATFATLHLRAGTPLKEVQEMLGHQDARTTLIYQETNLEDKKRRQENLWA